MIHGGSTLPAACRARGPLRLHRARFFDAQCSNDLWALRITHRGPGGEFDPRRALLTGADGRLCTLAGSVLADAVGVSTLAVTAEGAAVLVRQSRRNVASPGLLAPPGSGSLDPGDLGRGLAAGTDLLAAPGLPRQIRVHGALPLLLAVRAAAMWRARTAAGVTPLGEPRAG